MATNIKMKILAVYSLYKYFHEMFG